MLLQNTQINKTRISLFSAGISLISSSNITQTKGYYHTVHKLLDFVHFLWHAYGGGLKKIVNSAFDSCKELQSTTLLLSSGVFFLFIITLGLC